MSETSVFLIKSVIVVLALGAVATVYGLGFSEANNEFVVDGKTYKEYTGRYAMSFDGLRWEHDSCRYEKTKDGLRLKEMDRIILDDVVFRERVDGDDFKVRDIINDTTVWVSNIQGEVVAGFTTVNGSFVSEPLNSSENYLVVASRLGVWSSSYFEGKYCEDGE